MLEITMVTLGAIILLLLIVQFFMIKYAIKKLSFNSDAVLSKKSGGWIAPLKKKPKLKAYNPYDDESKKIEGKVERLFD